MISKEHPELMEKFSHKMEKRVRKEFKLCERVFLNIN